MYTLHSRSRDIVSGGSVVSASGGGGGCGAGIGEFQAAVFVHFFKYSNEVIDSEQVPILFVPCK